VVQGADGRILLEKTADLKPSTVTGFPMDYPADEKLTVTVWDGTGAQLLHYTEEDHDYIHIPKDNKGTPKPDKLITPCELVNAGQHIDQYRNTLYKPDLYYLEALRKDPDYLPALKALGEYYTRTSRFADALACLDRAWSIECRYNQNPEDGTVGYLRGICLRNLGRYEEAYNALYRAAWSYNAISPAMAAIALILILRRRFGKEAAHE
jgi:tetratricopeptide (TPR) repeat protein